jgi:hypothetical protein
MDVLGGVRLAEVVGVLVVGVVGAPVGEESVGGRFDGIDGSITIDAGIGASGKTTDSPKFTCAKVVLAEAKSVTEVIADAMVNTTRGFRNGFATVGPPYILRSSSILCQHRDDFRLRSLTCQVRELQMALTPSKSISA